MEQQIKFDKSFEALYKSAMAMADVVIVNKEMRQRFEKLTEEFEELMVESNDYQDKCAEKYYGKNNTADHLDHIKRIKGECGDLLFVLLHIAHIQGWTAFDLLHGAMSKMLARMNDVNYIAKN